MMTHISDHSERPQQKGRKFRKVIAYIVAQNFHQYMDDREGIFWLRHYRWPNGQPRCPHCHARTVRYVGKSTSREYVRCYQCKRCSRKFNDKTGTLFANSRLDMGDWFLIALLIELDVPLKSLRTFVHRQMDRRTLRRIRDHLASDDRLRGAMVRYLYDKFFH